jgi:hypothetical protein
MFQNDIILKAIENNKLLKTNNAFFPPRAPRNDLDEEEVDMIGRSELEQIKRSKPAQVRELFIRVVKKQKKEKHWNDFRFGLLYVYTVRASTFFTNRTFSVPYRIVPVSSFRQKNILGLPKVRFGARAVYTYSTL